MKLLIRIIYGNIDYLQQFVALNRKIEACLENVFKNYVSPFKSDYIPPPKIAINVTPASSYQASPRSSFDSLSD
jgi:hypothetical protein